MQMNISESVVHNGPVIMGDVSFRLRNVLCEYNMSLPSAANRALYPDLRLQVPTFHIFGITPEGDLHFLKWVDGNFLDFFSKILAPNR